MIRLGLAGACEHRLAGETVLLSQDWAVVQSPEDLAKIKTSESFQTLALTIKASAITGELENRLARSAGAGIRFAREMNMRTVLGQRFRPQAIRLSLEPDKNSADRSERSLALQEMERSLVSLLIEGHRRNYTRLLNRETSAGPWQVRAVEEFIHEHADLPLSLGDLAALTGVSARTLQFSFSKHRGVSPMQFLRATRLDRVRGELLRPDNRTSVTDSAARWGFLHFGRFAAEHRQRYQEMPSASLRRTKSLRSER